MNQEQIGTFIATMRKEKGMTQEQLVGMIVSNNVGMP